MLCEPRAAPSAAAVVRLSRVLRGRVLTPLHMLYDVARGLQLRVALRLHIQHLLQPLINHLQEHTEDAQAGACLAAYR